LDNQDDDQILEYYEVEEEGVDVPMVAETEPYLRRGLLLNFEYFFKVIFKKWFFDDKTFKKIFPNKNYFFWTDLPLRDFSTLSPDEIIEVLEDQRPKDIICFQVNFFSLQFLNPF